jgi:hypothetical protein
MRNFSTAILDELAGEELKPFYLLTMTIGGTTYRYTDCDIPLYVSSNTYTPLGFKFQNINYSMGNIVDRVNIQIDNLDSVMTALFVGGTAQGSATTLSLVVLDSANNPVGGTSTVLFQGEIDKWTLDEEKLKINVVSQFVKWQQSTLSRHSASCRWKAFKSTECNYGGGSTWCDRTYTRCEQLSNSSNFGGFRWLPSLEDADIYWGRDPVVKVRVGGMKE